MMQMRRFRLTGRRFMLASLSVLIHLFLIGCAVLTFRVYSQLDAYRTTETDDMSFTVTRLEVDHARLLNAAQTLANASQTPQRQTLDDLRRRFDAFYSRVGILHEGAAYRAGLAGAPQVALGAVAETLNQLVPLIDGPDAALAVTAPQIVVQIKEMTPAVTELARAGAALDVARAEARRADLTATLTRLAILSTLMLMAMVVLLIQLWRLYTRYRRRALENRATLQRVSTILDTALDTILVVDAQGRIVEANTTAEETFGLRKEDGTRKTIDAVLSRRGEDEGADAVPLTGEILIQSCSERPNRCSKLLARDRTGRLFPVEMSADVAWQDGREVCVCYLRDISRRLESEAEMQAAHDRALAGEQAQARFLGMISHEMRTPLNGILGTLDLMAETDLNAEQKRYARIVQSAGQQLLTQINDALDLTQAGAGRIALNVAPFDLDALIEEALAGQSSLAETMGTTLRTRSAAGSLRVVEGDRIRVLQVLVNLLSNAVKFTRGGDVAIDAVRPDPASPMVEIQVADTGCGISDADLPSIFDDFVRVGHPDKHNVPGTGLGLGIVRELVTLMGGTVGAESIPGEGSLFWVSLPLPKARQPQAGSRGDDRITLQEAEGVRSPRGLSILVADDNEANRFVLGEMLRKDGHRVEAVADGLAAVRMAQHHAFDLIIMDVRMPRMDGIAAARQIRRGDGASKKTRLVFLTAHVETGAPEEFSGLEAEAVLAKPLRRSALREALAGTLAEDALHHTFPGGLVDRQVLAQLADTLRKPAFAGLLGRFINEGDIFLSDLPALRTGSTKALIAALHHFAGSAATFGAARLQNALVRVEHALQAGETSRAALILDALPRLWAETVEALQEQRNAA